MSEPELVITEEYLYPGTVDVAEQRRAYILAHRPDSDIKECAAFERWLKGETTDQATPLKEVRK